MNWSLALKSGSAEKLSRALAGRSTQRKLTPPLEKYVRIRVPYVYADEKHCYSQVIREELKRIFDVELSGETLRPLFRELRMQANGSTATEEESAETCLNESELPEQPNTATDELEGESWRGPSNSLERPWGHYNKTLFFCQKIATIML